MMPPRERFARDQRKQDLLLASRAVRAQAALALEQLSGRADRAAEQTRRVAGWFKYPAIVAAVGAAAAAIFGRRRPRRVIAAPPKREPSFFGRLVSVALVGWRVWITLRPVLRDVAEQARRRRARKPLA